MKTIANFGLMGVISEDNKDIINFNHGSGKVTFIAATKPSLTSSFAARCLFSFANFANFLVSLSKMSLTARVRALSNPAT